MSLFPRKLRYYRRLNLLLGRTFYIIPETLLNRPFSFGQVPTLEVSGSDPLLLSGNSKPGPALIKAVEFIQQRGLDDFYTFGKLKLSSTEYTQSCHELLTYTPGLKPFNLLKHIGKNLSSVSTKWNSSDDTALLDAFHDYSGSLLQIQQHVFPGITIQLIVSRLKALANRLHSFSGDERKSLRAAMASHGRDWNKAAEFVATKDAWHCQAQATLYDTPYATLLKKRPPFSHTDLIRLNVIVKQYGTSDWKLIAEKFGDGRKPKFLKFHYTLGLSTLNKKPWSKEEDQYIIDSMLQEKVPAWSQISAGLGGVRSPQYVKARWDQINPAAKTGEWSFEEKALLNSLVKQHGIGWDRIAKLIKSRTSEACNRQWYKMNYPTLGSSVTVRKK